MKLRTKFNLVLLASFTVGVALAGLLSYRILQENAEEEVLAEARVMAESALAIRNYTGREIRPLLEPLMTDRFLPQSVPFYSAQATLKAVHQRFPDYVYKEAAINPTNLADRATDWEADIIGAFRNDPSLPEVVTTRDTPTGPSLILSHPVIIRDPGCLTCHSTPEVAPRSMVALYGATNGFGWQMNEVAGAQIVSIPMSVPMERAMRTFLTSMATLIVVFLIIAVLLNVLLQVVVIRPVLQIAAMASEVSLGNLDAPEYERPGNDEISSLAASFNRMRRSLESALQLLSR